MGSLIAVYVVVVLLKWGWEALDRIAPEPGMKTMSAGDWWREQRYPLARKALLHVVLCALWLDGRLLAPLNSTVGALLKGVDGDHGIAIAPLFPAVTFQTTALAAAVLDSFQKPIAKRIQSWKNAVEAPAP